MAFETLKIVAISYFNGVFLIILYKKGHTKCFKKHN